MSRHCLRNVTFRRSLICATRGLVWVGIGERNFRYQFLGAVAVLGGAWWLGLPAVQVAVLGLTAAGVLALEAMNTALETALDAVHPDYHEGIERAKDLAAGAVLLASLGAVFVGVLLLGGPIYRLLF